MSLPEAIAFCALIVGFIVAAGIVLSAYESRMKHRRKELELQVRLAEAKGRQRSDAEIGRMEERLQVLERIATDRSPDLAREIDALRLADAREQVQ
ncbi:MAG: hypothetical protein VX569_07675 [Pseudomonadota bacterium]|nr:hypothetical protein [Pseudomonadota bacterium]